MNRPGIIVYRQNDYYQSVYVSYDGGKTCYDVEDPINFYGEIQYENVKDVKNLVEVWRSGAES